MLKKINFYIALLYSVAVAALTAGVIIINNVEPGGFNLSLFYALFLFFCFSVATLAGFYLRRRFGQRELVYDYLKTAARQGLLIGVLLTAVLIMQAHNLFSPINAFALVLALSFLEAYFITR